MKSIDLHRPSRPSPRLSGLRLGAGGALAALMMASSAQATSFSVTSLVTDDQSYLTSQGYGAAATVDPALINPWGMDQAPGGPWFIGDTGTEATSSGYSYGTFYTGAGAKVGGNVTIPEGSPPNGPTGVVYNNSSGFNLPSGGQSQFIIASLDGGISALAAGSSSAVHVAQGPTPAAGPPHSIYTGLTMGDVGSTPYIYAANNGTGMVDVYNSSFQQVSLGATAFVDPTAQAAGLAPYNVQNLHGDIWVTYAIPGPGSAEAGLGSGAVAEFAPDGTLISDFAHGGQLSSPWALAIAPTSFGEYGGDVLVGNFSHDDDGQKDAFINIFSPTGTYLGVMKDGSGNPILLPGLWDMDVGDNGVAGSSGNIYFTAGIGDEQHGLFGYISAAPEPSTWMLMIAGIGMIGAMLRLGRRQGALAS